MAAALRNAPMVSQLRPLQRGRGEERRGEEACVLLWLLQRKKHPTDGPAVTSELSKKAEREREGKKVGKNCPSERRARLRER